MSATKQKNVQLILTGASGYLGQHLLSHWIRHGVLPPSDYGSESSNINFRITALYHKSEGFPEAVREFRKKHSVNTASSNIVDVVVKSIDLTDPGDIRSMLEEEENETPCCSTSEQERDASEQNNDKSNISIVVVHCAAISSPRVCQEKPDFARAINVPTKFFDAMLAGNTAPATSIIALSTDQVYDGTQESGSYYKEDEKDGLKPKNVYGQTKLELEEYLVQKQEQQLEQQKQSSLFAAVRSSIIMGPKAPIAPECAHENFLHFCNSMGASKEKGSFYTNEYRCVIRVDKVIATIMGLVSKALIDPSPSSPSPFPSPVVYNMGGPVRVNRFEMAKAVFDKFGYDETLLIAVEQKSPMSPLDISMDSSLIFEQGILKERDDGDPATYLKDLVDYVFDSS